MAKIISSKNYIISTKPKLFNNLFANKLMVKAFVSIKVSIPSI